jgi:hypothetical protein
MWLDTAWPLLLWCNEVTTLNQRFNGTAVGLEARKETIETNEKLKKEKKKKRDTFGVILDMPDNYFP